MVHNFFPAPPFPPQWQPFPRAPRQPIQIQFQAPHLQNARFQTARFPAPRPSKGFHQRPFVNSGFPIARPRITTQVPVGVDGGWSNTGWGAPVQVAQSPPSRPRIPTQVVCLLAAHLASEHAFATLANLNATCRAIHESTLHQTYKIVYWKWNGTSESTKRGQNVDQGWGMEYYATKEWNKKRWDKRLESVKGAQHIQYLLGPPLHRHFSVGWMNRKKWIPQGLIDTLKAAVTYKIDASAAIPDKLNNELEVYLCGKYRFGTNDVVDLLDAIEPPLQDVNEDISTCSETGFHTRLVLLLDTTYDDPIRWYSKQSGQTSARQTLETRTYPWLRQIDLVFCDADEFDVDRVAVAVVEGLTMLGPAVRVWWEGDNEVRPELVVKGIDAESARRCAELFSQSIEDDKGYSCIDFKLLGTDLVNHLDLTAALFILHPIRSAYASLCIREHETLGTTGSTSVAGLSAEDRGDCQTGEGSEERDIHAWVGIVPGDRQVDVTFTEGGIEHRESMVYAQQIWADC